MTLKIINICRHCKIEFPLEELSCECRHIRKGQSFEYYTCRECHRLRLLKYRATDKGKIAVRKARIKSETKYRYKQNARLILRQAIKCKRVIKPNECSRCGITKDIQGHHEDYSKPLDVIWLCRWCHIEADKLLKM